MEQDKQNQASSQDIPDIKEQEKLSPVAKNGLETAHEKADPHAAKGLEIAAATQAGQTPPPPEQKPQQPAEGDNGKNEDAKSNLVATDEEEEGDDQANPEQQPQSEHHFEGPDNSLINQQQRFFETPHEAKSDSSEGGKEVQEEADKLDIRKYGGQEGQDNIHEVKIEDDGHSTPNQIHQPDSFSEPHSQGVNPSLETGEPRGIAFDVQPFVAPPPPPLPEPLPPPPSAMDFFRAAVNESNMQSGGSFTIQLGLNGPNGNPDAYIQIDNDGNGHGILNWNNFDPFGGDGNVDVDITNNTLIIRGEGCDKTFLDAGSLSRLFDISGGATVVLQDLTLTHGKDDSGGAILNAGNLSLDNVCVLDNWASEYGGGISNYGHITSIVDSNFGAYSYADTGNYAGLGGGAIANFSSNTIDSIDTSGFYHNMTDGSGGAIYNAQTGVINSVSNNLFGFNASALSGGAFANEGELGSISGSTVTGGLIKNIFFQNGAESDGGAIVNTSTGFISQIQGANTGSPTAFNISDNLNSALGSGGFLSNEGQIGQGNYGGVYNLLLVLNSAQQGGAISSDGEIAGVGLNNNFYQLNSAMGDGGAVYLGTDNQLTQLANSIFRLNHSLQGSGGGVANEGDITQVLNTAFGAANFYNTALNGMGGGLYNSDTGTIQDIIDAQYYYNQAAQGGAIANEGTIGSFDVDNFSFNLIQFNSASLQGGGLYNSGMINDLPDTIKFSSNNVSTNGSGGGIFNSGDITTLNSFISGNSAYGGEGGGLYNSGTLGTIGVNAEFLINVAGYGGALYNAGLISNILGAYDSNLGQYVGANFDTNGASIAGGAIYNENVITNLSGSYNNDASSSFVNTMYGGGLYNLGTVTNLVGAVFDGLHVSQSGGAVYNDGILSNVLSSIVDNTAGQDGGGIYNAQGSLIDNLASSISGNVAEGFGGAVYNDATINRMGGDPIHNLFNIVYLNEATSGGGLYNDTHGLINLMTGVLYQGNTASEAGGGIYNLGNIGSDELPQNPTLISGFNAVNIPFYDQMPYLTDNGMIGVFFLGNSADVGGALYNDAYIRQISGIPGTSVSSGFTNNTSTDGGGGAIYNQGDIFAIFKTTFNTNSATGGDFPNSPDETQSQYDPFGGAIYNARTGDIAIVSNSTFFANTTPLDGGAIYNLGHFFAIDQSSFSNNQAAYNVADTSGRGGDAIANVSSGGDTGATHGIDYILNSTFANNGTFPITTADLGVYDQNFKWFPDSVLNGNSQLTINGIDIGDALGDSDGNGKTYTRDQFISELNTLLNPINLVAGLDLNSHVIVQGFAGQDIVVEAATVAYLPNWERGDTVGNNTYEGSSVADPLGDFSVIAENSSTKYLTGFATTVSAMNTLLSSFLSANFTNITYDQQTNPGLFGSDHEDYYLIDPNGGTITVGLDSDIVNVDFLDEPFFRGLVSQTLTFNAFTATHTYTPVGDYNNTYGGAILNTTTFEDFALVNQQDASIGQIAFSTFFGNYAANGLDIYNNDFNITPTPFDSTIGSINNSIFGSFFLLPYLNVGGDIGNIDFLYNTFTSDQGLTAGGPGVYALDLVSGNIEGLPILDALSLGSYSAGIFIPAATASSPITSIYAGDQLVGSNISLPLGFNVDLANPLVSAFFFTPYGNLFSDIDQRSEPRPIDYGNNGSTLISLVGASVVLNGYTAGDGELSGNDLVINGTPVIGTGLTTVTALANLIQTTFPTITTSVSGTNLTLTPALGDVLFVTSDGQSNISISDPAGPSFSNFNINAVRQIVLENFDAGDGSIEASQMKIFVDGDTGNPINIVGSNIASATDFANLILAAAATAGFTGISAVADGTTVTISSATHSLELDGAFLGSNDGSTPSFDDFDVGSLVSGDANLIFSADPLLTDLAYNSTAPIDTNWDRGAVELQTTGSVVPPIVFDLGGNGIQLISPHDSPITLANSDGTVSKMGWVSGEDAILVYDHNGDGLVTSLNEIALTKWDSTAQTDLQALQHVFDSNHDHVFDNMDESFSHFGVWQDINQNGMVDANEFKSLTDAGIQSIDLNAVEHLQSVDGNVSYGEGTFTTVDGHTGTYGDIGLGLDQVLVSDNIDIPNLDSSSTTFVDDGSNSTLTQAANDDSSSTAPTTIDHDVVIQDTVVQQTDPSATFTIDPGTTDLNL